MSAHDRAGRFAEAEAHPGFVRAYHRAHDHDDDGRHAPNLASLMHELREEYGFDETMWPRAVHEYLIVDRGAELDCEAVS